MDFGHFRNPKLISQHALPFLLSPFDLHKDDENVMTAPSWSKGWGQWTKKFPFSLKNGKVVCLKRQFVLTHVLCSHYAILLISIRIENQLN